MVLPTFLPPATLRIATLASNSTIFDAPRKLTPTTSPPNPTEPSQTESMSLNKRSSPPSPPPPSSTPPTPPGDLKQRVISCLNKLSDRDTLSVATSELESIARTLTHDSFSPFLSCIHNTDSSSKSPVRRQCVNLLALLSNYHGNSLSPHLPKMLSTLSRRLRDPDSSVRSACVQASAAISSRITDPPFFSSISKPLIDILTVDQDSNAQIGAAMCLAAAIDAAPEPEPEQLKKVLPRLGKLVKTEGFKAKAGALSVIGSIVAIGGASGKSLLDWLVPSLLEFLCSEDWAVRKAAAETLGKVAVAEKELAKEQKAACLNCLDNRRFDKVKAVREIMNHTLELWKQVPADSNEVPAPSLSRSFSMDNSVGGCLRAASRTSPRDASFKTPLPKKTVPTIRSPSSDASCVTTARKPSPANSNDSNLKTAMYHKPDHKKPAAWKIEIAVQQEKVSGDDIRRHDSGVSEPGEDDNDNGNSKPETKRVLFSSVRDEKQTPKVGGLRTKSRVVPYPDDENCYNKDVEVSNPTEEFFENPKDEDFSLIRDQLAQIENQQSSLLDLLQKFIGSSQNGINSLETRVHGLEMALDEISYDLAVSSGRIPNGDSAENTCCRLPGAEFLSPKFWRRAEGRYSAPRFSSSGSIQSQNADQNFPDKHAYTQAFYDDGHRFKHQDGGTFTTNSLVEFRGLSRANSGFYSTQMPNSRIQEDVASRLADVSPTARTVTVRTPAS